MRKLSSLQSALDRFYKLRQLFYYKVRHGLLQIAAVQRLSGKAENSLPLVKLDSLILMRSISSLSRPSRSFVPVTHPSK